MIAATLIAFAIGWLAGVYVGTRAFRESQGRCIYVRHTTPARSDRHGIRQRP